MHAHHLCDDFNRAFGTEAVARSNVQSLLAKLRQVSVCWQTLVIQRRAAPYICWHCSEIAYFAAAPITVSLAFLYRHAFCYARFGIKQRNTLPKREAWHSILPSAGLFFRPWKVLANRSWAG